MKIVIELPQANRVADRFAIRDVAQAVEDLGYFGVSVQDHIHFDGRWLGCGATDDDGRNDRRTMFEALTTLSYVAAITQHVRLMTSILLLPGRETILTAKQIATLDNLSDGRVSLGVGVGGSGTSRDSEANFDASLFSVNIAKEWAMLGVNVAKRGKLVDEQIAAFRRIWTDPVSTFKGELVSFDEIEIFPKPTQPGGPPIYIGGNSPSAIKRAVRDGDGWLPNHSRPEDVAAGIELLKQLSAEAGRSNVPTVALNMFFSLGSDVQAAEQRCNGTLSQVFGPQLTARNLIGTVEQMAPRIAEYERVGVSVLELKPVYRSVKELIAMLELFSTVLTPIPTAVAA